MKKLTLLGLFFLTTTTGNLFAKKIPISKDRDKFRLSGYADVNIVKKYNWDLVTGDLILIGIHIECSRPGEQKCRNIGGSIFNELEELNGYTNAEKTIAQSVINNGDIQIENGIASGNVIQTSMFLNESTGAYYYKTFTYSWYTSHDLSIESNLSVSEPF